MASRSSCKIAIIGGGVAGVSSFVSLVDAGFFSSNITIFDAGKELGGVWAPSRAYDGLASNTPGQTYSFINRPFYSANRLKSGGLVPHKTILEEIQSLIKTYGMLANAKLETVVLDLARKDKGGWIIRSHGPFGERTDEFEKVVVAQGTFTDPNVPKFALPYASNDASSRVVHASWFKNCELFDNLRHGLPKPSRVIVIGNNTSGTDFAVHLAKAGQRVTILQRRRRIFAPVGQPPVWSLGQHPAIFYARHFFYGRFGSRFLPFYLDPVSEENGFTRRLLHNTFLGSIIVKFSWWLLTWLLMRFWHCNDSSKPGFRQLKPTEHVIYDWAIAFCHPELPALFEKGMIKAEDGEATGLKQSGDKYELQVTTEDGSTRTLVADAIVFATGYNPAPAHPFIKPKLADELGVDVYDSSRYVDYDSSERQLLFSSILTLPSSRSKGEGEGKANRLFRGIVPVESASNRDIVFVGMIFTLINLCHIQIQAEWVADYFLGSFISPPKAPQKPFTPATWGSSVEESILVTIPPVDRMYRETSARKAWTNALLGPKVGKSGLILGSQAPESMLLRDMGIRRRMKEFGMTIPQDFRYIQEEKRARNMKLQLR